MPRPIAQGVLSGLVAIPVEIHTATQARMFPSIGYTPNADRASVTRYFVLHASRRRADGLVSRIVERLSESYLKQTDLCLHRITQTTANDAT
jgi:hypothetical protein